MKQFHSIDRATTELEAAYEYFNRLCQTFPTRRTSRVRRRT